MMETQTVTSVTGKKSSPPENNTNESAEQNIDKNSLDEYEIVDNDHPAASPHGGAHGHPGFSGFPEAINPGRSNLCRRDRYQSTPLTETKRLTCYTARSELRRDLSDNVINLSEDLSTLEASVEHCNAFAETCDKPEADNESSKNTAHDLDLTLQKQKTEKQSEDESIINRRTVWGEGQAKPSEQSQRRIGSSVRPTDLSGHVWPVCLSFARLCIFGTEMDT
ncbi:hypothetical protein DdX_17968 [Ditylenchus destructor]|uniref:Uncharacterized protein n=1 Tax=Ditylenchus destructor TaxID=166010 RepID=A0AAD4MQZ6_9BILA|nr:hypothetical protein DdX_17968 [Ditylenchus destructor]